MHLILYARGDSDASGSGGRPRERGTVKRDLMDILCCPVCKGDLVLTVKKENKVEILAGSLRCGACKHDYPIDDGIPNLLPPESA